MIQYIGIGDQIYDNVNAFAWYDTVQEVFIEVGGQCVWSSWEDFLVDMIEFPPDNPVYTKARFQALFPSEITLQ